MRMLGDNAAKKRVGGYLVLAMFAVSVGVAQEAAGWAGAKVTKTDLLTGETNYGKFVYYFASVMTRAGCHVAMTSSNSGPSRSLMMKREPPPPRTA